MHKRIWGYAATTLRQIVQDRGTVPVSYNTAYDNFWLATREIAPGNQEAVVEPHNFPPKSAIHTQQARESPFPLLAPSYQVAGMPPRRSLYTLPPTPRSATPPDLRKLANPADRLSVLGCYQKNVFTLIQLKCLINVHKMLYFVKIIYIYPQKCLDNITIMPRKILISSTNHILPAFSK